MSEHQHKWHLEAQSYRVCVECGELQYFASGPYSSNKWGKYHGFFTDWKKGADEQNAHFKFQNEDKEAKKAYLKTIVPENVKGEKHE